MTERVERETVEDIISTLNIIQFFDQAHDVDLSAAAKTLKALIAERDALEAELAEDEKKRADDAEAENRKLREALAQVVEMAETTKQYVKKSTPNATEEWTKGFMQGLNAAAGDVSRPARAALAEQEKTDDQ